MRLLLWLLALILVESTLWATCDQNPELVGQTLSVSQGESIKSYTWDIGVLHSQVVEIFYGLSNERYWVINNGHTNQVMVMKELITTTVSWTVLLNGQQTTEGSNAMNSGATKIYLVDSVGASLKIMIVDTSTNSSEYYEK